MTRHNCCVWGDDKYELANFDDNQLVPAIMTLAVSQDNPLVTSTTWASDLRAELQAARVKHSDIKVALGRLRVKEDKVELARLLWPTLRARCEAEYSTDHIQTPVLKLVLEVRELIAKLSGVFALHGP